MAYYPPYFNRGNYINPMQSASQMPMQSVPQMEYPQYQQMPQQTSDMIWVLNESEATAYPVAPNNSVVLWDKNNPVIYVKSVNMQGVPSMRVLDFSERMPDNAPKTVVEHKCQCGGKFVSKEDFNALQSKLEAMQSDLEELKAKPKTKTTKKAVEEAEDGE
jgi:hypothetical protein